ncbi:hypothetical protein GCM10010273_18010 [Streptomyces lavendulocolor]
MTCSTVSDGGTVRRTVRGGRRPRLPVRVPGETSPWHTPTTGVFIKAGGTAAVTALLCHPLWAPHWGRGIPGEVSARGTPTAWVVIGGRACGFRARSARCPERPIGPAGRPLRPVAPAMTGLGPVAWPPTPLRTERLVLRASEARDRTAFVELYGSPEVGTYIAGSPPVTSSSARCPRYPAGGPASSWSTSTER